MIKDKESSYNYTTLINNKTKIRKEMEKGCKYRVLLFSTRRAHTNDKDNDQVVDQWMVARQ